MNILDDLKRKFADEYVKVTSMDDLNAMQIKYLGKKSAINNLLKDLKEYTDDERKKYAKQINTLKNEFKILIEDKREELYETDLNAKLLKERIDVTIPGFYTTNGHLHPLTKMRLQIENVFTVMGYKVVKGPEVESDYYNFELLNIPKNHPARDMQDTFYITDEYLLRTHTSPVQVREMLRYTKKQPIKIISPGKVYRHDDDDATHSHQFLQVEGLVVDKDISLSHLKGTLEELVKAIFGSEREIRLRPSYFPFTEPSVEVDVDCFNCDGVGCKICKNTGWIEVLGAGMVHPNVLQQSGYDPEIYSGFAFGIGVERFAMLKYGVTDIREFFANDIRFIEKFYASDGGKY